MLTRSKCVFVSRVASCASLLLAANVFSLPAKAQSDCQSLVDKGNQLIGTAMRMKKIGSSQSGCDKVAAYTAMYNALQERVQLQDEMQEACRGYEMSGNESAVQDYYLKAKDLLANLRDECSNQENAATPNVDSDDLVVNSEENHDTPSRLHSQSDTPIGPPQNRSNITGAPYGDEEGAGGDTGTMSAK